MINVVIAGSTHHTLACAASLSSENQFKITAVITPSPKPIGRKQVITKNPMQQWAEENKIKLVLVQNRLDSEILEAIQDAPCDILLVVDFGFIVPDKLLEFPKIAPVNIHPSDLPRYRGSSPGQFALLFGETASAVTLMKMDSLLDHGPIITKLYFEIDPHWTAQDYYAHAFELVSHELPDLITEFTKHPRTYSPQPDESPTPTARMLSRTDGFVPLNSLKDILAGKTVGEAVPFLSTYSLEPTAQNLFNMWRGLTPWPGIWTETSGKRMKILEMSLQDGKIKLEKIQFEGKTATTEIPRL